MRRLDTGRVPQDFFLETIEKKLDFVVTPELDAPLAATKQESDSDSDNEGEVRLFMATLVCPFRSPLGFLAIRKIEPII